MSAALQTVLDRLEKVKRRGDNAYKALCPAHDDHHPSLYVTGKDGKVLLHCKSAGCNVETIVAALGLTLKDLFDHDPFAPPRPVARSSRQPPKKKPMPIRKAPDAPPVRWMNTALAAYQNAQKRPEMIDWLAGHLGVDDAALRDLRIGWLDDAQAIEYGSRVGGGYTIPERDGLNRVVGVAIRKEDDSKFFFPGGQRGLTIPASLAQNPPEKLYVTEGMSDCAAMLSHGYPCIARASATEGVDALFDFFTARPSVKLVLIGADNDDVGVKGATACAESLRLLLGRDVRWTAPPKEHKDFRAWLNATRGPGRDE